MWESIIAMLTPKSGIYGFHSCMEDDEVVTPNILIIDAHQKLYFFVKVFDSEEVLDYFI